MIVNNVNVGTTLGHEIKPDDIVAVERLIRPYIRSTPVIELRGEDFSLGNIRLSLKLELLQYAGSFKVRGAFNNLLARDIPPAGVAAASGGNHGAAVAFAAMRLGIPARIFIPRISSPAKIQKIRDFGAELSIGGESYSDALDAADEFVRNSGALSVHAFDQLETILGQATLGLEFQHQARQLNSVLVSVGGGGLLGGVAAWFQNSLAVVGVEPERSPTLTKALEAGEPVDAESGGIAADSLAPRRVGKQVYPILSRYVRNVILVTDEEIRIAQHALWEKLRIVTEPGGAAAFGALLAGKHPVTSGEHVGVVISGGNTVAVNFELQERRLNK
jgi:threonine dehydratase